jgi:hypothetical protein
VTSSPAGIAFRVNDDETRISHPLMVASFKVTSSRVLCTAPCELELPHGSYQVYLDDGKRKAKVSEPVVIQGDSEMHGGFESRKSLRTFGWSLLGASVAGGVTLLALGGRYCNRSQPNCSDSDAQKGTLLSTSGFLVLLGGGIPGLVFGLKSDRPTVRVTPTVSAPEISRAGTGGSAGFDMLGLQGMQLEVGGIL